MSTPQWLFINFLDSNNTLWCSRLYSHRQQLLSGPGSNWRSAGHKHQRLTCKNQHLQRFDVDVWEPTSLAFWCLKSKALSVLAFLLNVFIAIRCEKNSNHCTSWLIISDAQMVSGRKTCQLIRDPLYRIRDIGYVVGVSRVPASCCRTVPPLNEFMPFKFNLNRACNEAQ